MLSADQRAAVQAIFAAAGYTSTPEVAPVTSEDERIFVVPPTSELAGRRDLEAALQTALGRKVWIVERSASWSVSEPLH